jgi:hypothetical protein
LASRTTRQQAQILVSEWGVYHVSIQRGPAEHW